MTKPTVAELAKGFAEVRAQSEAIAERLEALVASIDAARPGAAERPAAQRAPRPDVDLDAYCERYAPRLAARENEDFLRYLDKVAAEHGYRVAYHLHKAARRLQAERPAVTEAEMADDIPF